MIMNIQGTIQQTNERMNVVQRDRQTSSKINLSIYHISYIFNKYHAMDIVRHVKLTGTVSVRPVFLIAEIWRTRLCSTDVIVAFHKIIVKNLAF